MTSPPSPLGEELRWMRKAAGLTAIEIAALIHSSQPVVSRWETGLRRPSARVVRRWRIMCTWTIENRVATPQEAKSLLADLKRIQARSYLQHLARLQADDPAIESERPELVLIEKDVLVDVLFDEWLARSKHKASAREHCEALANAVLREAGALV